LIKKDEMMTIDMYHLHRNPEQWPEPEKYIPERFDPSSPYYLTPNGEKRHHMSFAPFLGGKRICLGKTFVEVVSKAIGTTIVGHFDF
jgi:cytochrome P450